VRRLGQPPVIPGVETRIDGDVWISAISSPAHLTQIAGWYRFTAPINGSAFYRGQTKIHSTMIPSAIRNPLTGRKLNVPARTRHARAMTEYVDQLVGAPCSCPGGPFTFPRSHLCLEQVARTDSSHIVPATYRAAIEPLLQHYGIRTRWLDVVDNVWVALWFACFQERSYRRFASHARRSVAREGLGAKAYIAVMDSGVTSETAIPGYRVGTETRFVDLRYAVPSIYLRPHAQHGVLMAVSSMEPSHDGDLSTQVAGYIEIDLFDAVDWLGDGSLARGANLFPPANEDRGFERLIDAPKPDYELMGEVKLYGPGQ